MVTGLRDLLDFAGVSVYWEPRDLWVGAYVDTDRNRVYVCPLPMLVVRWQR